MTAVVPQDNLSGVSAPHHQVGMKPGESHRHHRRLRKEENNVTHGKSDTRKVRS